MKTHRMLFFSLMACIFLASCDDQLIDQSSKDRKIDSLTRVIDTLKSHQAKRQKKRKAQHYASSSLPLPLPDGSSNSKNCCCDQKKEPTQQTSLPLPTE